MHVTREIAARATEGRLLKDPMAEGIEKVKKDAAFSPDAEKRIAAVCELRGNLEALMFVLMRSTHSDSAALSRKAYGESLDQKNEAIVNKCVAIFSDNKERRTNAVIALKSHKFELEEVMVESKYQDTRAMARSMLSV
jgi:hypothetical protein